MDPIGSNDFPPKFIIERRGKKVSIFALRNQKTVPKLTKAKVYRKCQEMSTNLLINIFYYVLKK